MVVPVGGKRLQEGIIVSDMVLGMNGLGLGGGGSNV